MVFRAFHSLFIVGGIPAVCRAVSHGDQLAQAMNLKLFDPKSIPAGPSLR
jgi:hypothetical protein